MTTDDERELNGIAHNRSVGNSFNACPWNLHTSIKRTRKSRGNEQVAELSRRVPFCSPVSTLRVA